MTLPVSIAASDLAERELRAAELAAIGRRLDARGHAAATSGNYSAKLDDGSILVTRSGGHKGRLGPLGFMRLTDEGVAIDEGRPSAEAALHVMLYRRFPTARAVLHWHSPGAMGLSRAVAPATELTFADHEMLKAFPGITTHETRVALPIVENSQDMAAIEAAIAPALDRADAAPAFVIRSHGIYAWGADTDTAERIAEAIEWLVAAEIAERSMRT
jgi:methylthioribulose-1-phosphate dehydratase